MSATPKQCPTCHSWSVDLRCDVPAATVDALYQTCTDNWHAPVPAPAEPGETPVQQEQRRFYENVDQLLAEVATLRAERDRLTAEHERAEMKLVACMTATLQNTPETASDRLPQDHPYWSVAYSDVCRSVDREMQERARAEDAEASRREDRATLRALVEKWRVRATLWSGEYDEDFRNVDAVTECADELLALLGEEPPA